MKKIPELKLSKKGNDLLDMYKQMVEEGYRNDYFNPKKYKEFLKNIFEENNIKTVLDYGSGQGKWEDKIDNQTNYSALDYFGLDKVYQYEPTIVNSKKEVAECVLCFDVLEHIFISDLKNIITDLYNHASKMVVLQIACYDANAKLPNGENAHVSVRNPLWWKGFLDSISSDFNSISTVLICTTEKNNASVFKTWSKNKWNESKTYKTEL